MFRQVLKSLGYLLFTITYCSSIGIDDKLDFGSSGTHPSFRTQDNVYRSPHLPVSYKSTVTKIGINDNLDDNRVVCGSGGCNKTESEDTLKTDVVVRIETKIDLNRNTSKQVGDIPDVPVVVGFNSQLDETNDEKPRPGYGSASPRYGSASPGYSSGSPGLGSSNIAPFPGMPIYSSNNQLFYPSTRSYGDNGNPQYRRIDYGMTPELPFPERSISNIKFKTLPPVAISLADNTQNNYVDIKNLDGMELTIPYFEPAHHTHHFGEIPPPQHAWYPKKANSFNPVEFKTTKPMWTPSVWYKMVMSPHRHSTMSQEGQCFCQTGQPGLNWYPSENRRNSDRNVGKFGDRGDPGSQINDKLAPLN